MSRYNVAATSESETIPKVAWKLEDQALAFVRKKLETLVLVAELLRDSRISWIAFGVCDIFYTFWADSNVDSDYFNLSINSNLINCKLISVLREETRVIWYK